MVPYDSYKPSGESWLGDIPSDWDVRPLKHIFAIQKRIAGQQGHTVLSITQSGIKPKDMSSQGQFAEDYSNYQLVYPGDFAMNHMDLLTGWVDISRYEGVTSPDYRVFTNRNATNYLSEYYKYILQYCYSNKVFYGLGQGVAGFGRWRLPADMFLNFKLPVPTTLEQRAIVDYLDNRVSDIDSIIADVKASIEEYKAWKASIIYEAVTKGLDPNVEMKDTGVPWIGYIPKQWNMCSIKRLTDKIGSGKTPHGGAEVYTTEGVLFLRSQNIYNTGLEIESAYYISESMDAEMANSRVQYQDVLLNITGGSIGRCCIYDLEDVPANVNQHVCILRTDHDKLLPSYLRYFWNSAAGPIVVAQYQTGGNRLGLNFEQIGATKIPYCDLETQQQIVEHLDMKCRDIDELISEKYSLIQDLESYKKSLIFEVVTGKRKVC